MRYRVSISYFDYLLGKRESQTRQVFNFAGNFVVSKLFVGTKFCKNDQKSQNLIPAKFNNFKVCLIAVKSR